MESSPVPLGNRGAGQPSPEFRIEAVDAGSFTLRRFGQFRHNYDRHPLLQLDRLAQLARDVMPLGKCRFVEPGLTAASPFFHTATPGDGKTIDEVFERIEEPGSWIAMYNIEVDPTYQAFLWDVLNSAGELVTREETPYEVRGFIFISAPPSVTPFHIDRENNFWMNIRGRKVISVWDRDDRSIVSQKDVEEFIFYRALDNVILTNHVRGMSQEFDCGPGDGVYFPSTTPHMTRSDRSWAVPGDCISISMGIDFYTDVTRHAANVHAFNHVLRKFGLSPEYPGKSPILDRFKYPLGKTYTTISRLRGYELPPGF